MSSAPLQPQTNALPSNGRGVGTNVQAPLHHLSSLTPQPAWQIPNQTQHVQARPKIHRLILHSADGTGASPLTKTFDLRTDSWGLRQNLDVGTTHYRIVCDRFVMYSDNSASGCVEVRLQGLPLDSCSYDTSTQSASDLLELAVGDSSSSWASIGQSHGIELSGALPSQLTVQLRTRDSTLAQQQLAADATVRWTMILSIIPS